jgi:transcription antitermination protein NusB
VKSRHKARELVLQTLYALDFNGQLREGFPQDFPGLSEAEIALLEPDLIIFARFLIMGTLEHIDEVDEMISRFSTNRPIERIDIVDRNILRFSIFSLLYVKDIHSHVVIDEAVKLSQEFSSEVNYKFINGILDSIQKQLHDNP